VLSWAATLVLGSRYVNGSGGRRQCDRRRVQRARQQNGAEVRDGIAYEIKAGDVVSFPAGTWQWFPKIEAYIELF